MKKDRYKILASRILKISKKSEYPNKDIAKFLKIHLNLKQDSTPCGRHNKSYPVIEEDVLL